MTLPLSLILPLLLQVGPFVSPGAAPPIALPPAIERRGKARAAEPAVPKPDQLQLCLTSAETDPDAAMEAAEAWRDAEKGSGLIGPNHCLGLAHSQRQQWGDAAAAFLAARDAVPMHERPLRARYGGMAGNAALAGGLAEQALAALDTAHADALAGGDVRLGGELSIDRASALVALKRDDEAALALAEARTASPDNALGWLLSATLSRRQGKLADAQAQIETAAQLLPVDPEIGLEAGVIAVLSGRDEAARKSWQSVIDAAPQSNAAQTAARYMEQIKAP